MIFVTGEYNFPNPKLNEIIDFINDTLVEHNKKFGNICCRKIDFKYNIKLFDKLKNKTKNAQSRNKENNNSTSRKI